MPLVRPRRYAQLCIHDAFVGTKFGSHGIQLDPGASVVSPGRAILLYWVLIGDVSVTQRAIDVGWPSSA